MDPEMDDMNMFTEGRKSILSINLNVYAIISLFSMTYNYVKILKCQMGFCFSYCDMILCYMVLQNAT